MPPRKHVVITGTGRAGTTFLVELLTFLGLDTGYTKDNLQAHKSGVARAGLERDIREADCPYVVKSPWFCDYADEALSRGDFVVERIFVPIRDLFAAAESRRSVEIATRSGMSLATRLRRKFRPKFSAGGLWHRRATASGRPDGALSEAQQEQVLLEKIYSLLLGASGHQVPITLLQYPKLVRDDRYLYAKLAPILPGVDFESFQAAFAAVARPEWVHDFRAGGGSS